MPFHCILKKYFYTLEFRGEAPRVGRTSGVDIAELF